MTKRRIAAGLVALSLIAPMTTSVSVSVAQENPAPSNEDPSIPASDPTAETIDADGIASGVIDGMWKLSDVGWVEKQRGSTHGGMVGGRLTSLTDGRLDTRGLLNERLDGYTVYSQWMDEDGAVSPVFSAQTQFLGGTNADKGSFVFHYPNWTDANGKEHIFNADPVKERIRLWAAPGQTGPGGGELFTIRQAPWFQPGFMNNTDSNDDEYAYGPWFLQFADIFTYEMPTDSMYAPQANPRFRVDDKGWPVDTSSADARSSVSGSVWWETGQSERNYLTFPLSTGENHAKQGQARVITSILTEQGVVAFEELSGLRPMERMKKQREILEAHPEYIAETVAAETDDQGRYYARFNKKDFNRDYLYQFVQVKRGGDWYTQPAYSSYLAPIYGNPQDLMNIPQSWNEARHSWTDMHFGLVQTPKQNTVSLDKVTASAGDELTPTVNATPAEGSEAYLQWFNSAGQPILLDGSRGEQKIPVTGSGVHYNAALTVPSTRGDDTYNIRLYVGGTILDAASVSINGNAPSPLAAKYNPKYETTFIKPLPGEDLSLGCGAPSADDPENLKVSGGVSCTNLRAVARIANLQDIPAGDITSITVTGVEEPSLFVTDISSGWAGGQAGGNHIGQPSVVGTHPVSGSKQNLDTLRTKLGMSNERTESDIPVGISIARAKKGQAQNVKVRVTYTDNSYDDITARFVYGDRDQTTELSYTPRTADVGIKASIEPKILGRNVDGTVENRPVSVVSRFAKGTSPEGIADSDWSVDPTTGVVTWTPARGTPVARYHFPVTATLTTGETLTGTADFTVRESVTPTLQLVKYQLVTVRQGDATDVAPPHVVGQSITGLTYKMIDEDQTDFPWVMLNEDGSLRLRPGTDVQVGTHYIPIMVTADQHPSPELVYVEVEITPAIQVTAAPTVYPVMEGDDSISGEAEPGATVTVTLPDGTTVTGTAADDGMFTISVHPTKLWGGRRITVVAEKDGQKPSVPKTIPIFVQYPNLRNPDGKPAPGAEITIPNDGGKIPDGTDITVTGPGDAKIDENGNLVVTPKEDAKPGDTITVDVTYPNGRTDTVTVIVGEDPDRDHDGVPNEQDAYPDDPAAWLLTTVATVYPVVWVRAGETATSAQPLEDLLATPKMQERRQATGETYTIGADVPAGLENVAIDPVTHQVSFTAAATLTAGTELAIPVTVTRTGHRPEHVAVPVRIIAGSMAEEYAPALPATAALTAGSGVQLPVTPATLPEHTTFAVTSPLPGDWIAAVDQATGAVTVYAPYSAQVGDKAVVKLEVTYPDGTKDTLTTTVTVDIATAQPFYEQTKVRAGAEATLPLQGVDTLPEGTTFSLPDKVPAGLTLVEVAGSGELTATADATALPTIATLPVTLTYPDGTGATLTATVQILSPGGHRTLAEDETLTPVTGTTAAAGITRTNPTEPVTYTVTDKPAGWSVAVRADGSIQATPPQGTAPGTKAQVTVQATYPDGSANTVPVTIEVADTSPGDASGSSGGDIAGIVLGSLGGVLLLLAAGVAAVGMNPSLLPPQVRDMIAPYVPWINGK
ncbi:Rib/alpha-like domain-containing protein [Corynebacterium glucuronolyticum]